MRIISRYIFIRIIIILCFIQDLEARQFNNVNEKDSVIVNKLNSFKTALQESSPDASLYYNWILNYLGTNDISDSILISDCYYYTGTYKYIGNSYNDAIELLQEAIRYRIAVDSIDDIYARARTNLALSYMYTGKPEEARVNLEMALKTREGLFGTESPILLRTLLNLSAIYIDMNMHERALPISLRGVHLAENHPEDIDKGTLVNFYYNSGVSYMNILDYNRAKRNFEIAYDLAQESLSLDPEKLLLLYNSIAACNYELGNSDLSDQYFGKALELIDSTGFSGRLVNAVYENYAFFLAGIGMYDKAEHYLLSSVEEAEKEYGKESRDHIIQLLNYSYFLINNMANYSEAEEILKKVLPYVNENKQDKRVRSEAFLYFSRLMYYTGRNS